MALQNIGASNSDDAFYRYKMPKMITKIEECKSCTVFCEDMKWRWITKNTFAMSSVCTIERRLKVANVPVTLTR